MNRLRAAARRLLPAYTLASALLCACAGAQEEAAVLAKGSGPYFESYLAFQRALGRPVAPYDLSAGRVSLPGSLKAAAAFGARAAALRYPEGAKVVCALAPGFNPAGSACLALVSALPEPGAALEAYLTLQPDLKKLTVIYHAGARPPYLDALAGAASKRGIEIAALTAAGPDDIPGKLRSLQEKAGAIWLLPEPALITRTALEVLASFSCASKIPFYAPSAGLVELGATAAFAPGPEEAGAAAARAFASAKKGDRLPPVIYPASVLTYDAAAAAKCGFGLSPRPGAGR